MLNASKPPFDNIKARQAVAYAYNFEDYNAILGDGILTQATGPFAPGNVGNLDDSGFPTYDPDMAEQLVQEYEEETGQPLSFTYTTTQAQVQIEGAQFLKEQAEAVGMSVDIVTVDQSTQIDNAISGDFEAIGWRNHPGGDPDTQYVWWKSFGGDPPNPINFARFDDPEIDRLLKDGRTNPDDAARRGSTRTSTAASPRRPGTCGSIRRGRSRPPPTSTGSQARAPAAPSRSPGWPGTPGDLHVGRAVDRGGSRWE